MKKIKRKVGVAGDNIFLLYFLCNDRCILFIMYITFLNSEHRVIKKNTTLHLIYVSRVFINTLYVYLFSIENLNGFNKFTKECKYTIFVLNSKL